MGLQRVRPDWMTNTHFTFFREDHKILFYVFCCYCCCWIGTIASDYSTCSLMYYEVVYPSWWEHIAFPALGEAQGFSFHRVYTDLLISSPWRLKKCHLQNSQALSVQSFSVVLCPASSNCFGLLGFQLWLFNSRRVLESTCILAPSASIWKVSE